MYLSGRFFRDKAKRTQNRSRLMIGGKLPVVDFELGFSIFHSPLPP